MFRLIHKTILKTTFALFLIGVFFPASTVLAANSASADKIKAAYIYQLTQFVTWPDTTLSQNTHFNICILDQDRISKELDPLHQHVIGRQSIKISYPKTINTVNDCNILYIATTKKQNLQAILANTRTWPMLTVSSIPDFTAMGGGIGFVIFDNKVRLEINRAPARQAGIKISAKLLEIASLVRSKTPGKAQP